MPSPATMKSVTPALDTAGLILDITAWTYATFVKVSSGLVAIGTDPSIRAATDSKGILLASNVAFTMILAPATQIFAVSDAGSEVVCIGLQTLPFIPQFIEAVTLMAQSLTRKPMPSAKPGEIWPGYTDWVKAQKR